MENEYLIQRFDDWNIKKKNIQFFERSWDEDIYFKEGDIWWCSIGFNIGSESYGKGENFRRPVLVIKKLSSDLCIALPITSQCKLGTWFENIVLNNENRYVMLYQIRTFNKKRFTVKLGEVDDVDLKRVKEKLKVLLELL